MIKSLAFFPSQCALNSGPVLEAIMKCCRTHGIALHENDMHSDAVLLWSVLWAGRMANNQKIYRHYRDSGRPVLVVDIGAFQRGITWKLALNNINAEGVYGHQQDLDNDRPRRLGLIRTKPRDSKPHVLIACQNHHSLQMTGLQPQAHWLHCQIEAIRSVTDRPIRVRPHPRSPLNFDVSHSQVTLEIPRKTPHTYDDFDLDVNCHAVVNINSGPGVMAAINHTPTIVHESSLARPVSISIAEIEQPPAIDRERWLIEISHTEYLLPEIEQGLWVKRLASWL